MTSSDTRALYEAALIPLFLGKQGCNITFVVDVSENMRAVLGTVKRLLIRALLTKASLRDSLFNIMTFSDKLSCWSHHMLPCAADTVYMALSWIHSISCRPGRDLLTALTTALADPACHAIHLLCTDLPDHPEAVLTALPAVAAGRPLKIFYLQDSCCQLSSNTRDYLQCLTQATRGSCYVIRVNLNGVLEKVIPLCVMDNQSSVPTMPSVEFCCPSTSVSPHASSSLLRCSLDNPLSPLTARALSDQSPEFWPGCRVLARREVDGLYYMGTVIQQVQGCRGVCVVQFDHPGSYRFGAVSSQRQLVCSLDMINDNRAHTLCLVPGNTVLSPWEPDLRRYGPGRVMAATECREGFGVDGVTSLHVLMWNSCVSLVPGSLVLPISVSQHDRIVRELQITTPARSHCSWLRARSSSGTPQLFCSKQCPSSSHCCSVTSYRPYSSLPSWRSSCGRMDGFQRVEQDPEVTGSDNEVPSSSLHSEDETRVTTPPAATLRSKEQRPPWRYWRRTGPEPQHRQPGSAVIRRTSPSLRMSSHAPQISALPNHSSLFQSLPGAKGRGANIGGVFGATSYRPQPPVGLRPFSGNNATTVFT